MNNLRITRNDLLPASRTKSADAITGNDLPWTSKQLHADCIELNDDGKIYCIKNRDGSLSSNDKLTCGGPR